MPLITALSLLANLILGALAIFLYQHQAPAAAVHPSQTPSYETGFTTDFADATRAITTTQRATAGHLRYNKTNNTVERISEPGAPQYFGEPSAELDAAWYELMRGEFFALTEQEAQVFLDNPVSDSGNLVRVPTTDHYHAELGMFHNLHCVNALRKRIDSDYYSHEHSEDDPSIFPVNWHRVHIDHCLENLMQAVLCTADLTPVPLYAWEGSRLALGVTGNRTCRDFTKIHAWLAERNADGNGFDGL